MTKAELMERLIRIESEKRAMQSRFADALRPITEICDKFQPYFEADGPDHGLHASIGSRTVNAIDDLRELAGI